MSAKLIMDKNFDKITVCFPSGETLCYDVVADTFRETIKRIGLQWVRSLEIFRNSIHIVSTVDEVRNSTGRKKEHIPQEIKDKPDALMVCTQFSTADKFKILQWINSQLNLGLVISCNKGQSITIPSLSDSMMEGALIEVNTNRYERNKLARKLCIEHYGNRYRCEVCGFDFEQVYGKRDGAEPYIEVHHINPLADKSKKGISEVNYATDLIPLCANCHRMIHTLGPSILSPDELRERLRLKRSES